jgi:hypothetical protein
MSIKFGPGVPARELRLHVLLVQLLDRTPGQQQLLGDLLDRAAAAAPTDVVRKSLGVERIVRQEMEALALHRPAPMADNAPYLEAQVYAHLAVGKIARLTVATVVPTHAQPTALAADRSFARRRRVRIRACGSPKNPRTLGSGRKPGNQYASHRPRRRVVLAIRI